MKNTKDEKHSKPDPVANDNSTAVIKQLKLIPLELHACMGLNACKNHDMFGDNECAGMGYCATNVHYCHTMNNCKGQGGCGLYGTAEEQSFPGQNKCSWQGSCGTPIPSDRFSTQGPNQGKSVWILARALFENRMKEANRTIGKSPMENGPSIEYLKKYGLGSSCGYSGNKGCSYVSDDKRKQNNLNEMQQWSRRELEQTMQAGANIRPEQYDTKAILANKCDPDAKPPKK